MMVILRMNSGNGKGVQTSSINLFNFVVAGTVVVFASKLPIFAFKVENVVDLAAKEEAVLRRDFVLLIPRFKKRGLVTVKSDDEIAPLVETPLVGIYVAVFFFARPSNALF